MLSGILSELLNAEIIPAIASGIISSGVISYFLDYNKQKNINKIEQNYKMEIENMKSKISENQLILSNIYSNAASGYQVTQQRRIEAIDKTWAAVNMLKSEVSTILFLYDILLPSEYNDIFTNPKLSDIKDSVDKNKMLYLITDITNTIMPELLYMSNTLTNLFDYYKALTGRIYIKFCEGLVNRNIQEWNKDSGLTNIVKELIDKEYISLEYNKVLNTKISTIIELIELEIIQECKKVISGKNISEHMVADMSSIKVNLEKIGNDKWNEYI